MVLSCEKLTKVYRMGGKDITALRSVTFAVMEGELLVVMGASGSGKSTLLALLGGLDMPTSGNVRLDGAEIFTLSDTQVTCLRREKVGFIFQFFNLLPTLTAFENVYLPFLIAGKNDASSGEKAMEMLKLVGLESRESHKPDELSGGEQQRVAIARALVTSPAVILADEPTGNLDSRNSLDVMEILRRSSSSLRQTIVLATHNPHFLKYADRVLFLKDGEITGEEILKGKNVDEKFLSDFLQKYSS